MLKFRLFALPLDTFGFLVSRLGNRGIYFVSKVLAYFLFDLVKLRRRVILKNLDIVYGNNKSYKQKLDIGRDCIASFMRTALTFSGSPWLFNKLEISFENRNYIDQSLAQNKGVYVLGIHSGNFALMCHASTKHIAPTHAVTKPIGGPMMSKWVHERRKSHGEFEIERRKPGQAATAIREILDRNEIVGFMVDQRRRKGILSPLFGQPAYTNTGLFFLWKQRPAPIVPVIIHQTSYNKHTLRFFKPLEVIQRDGQTDDQFFAENTATMNTLVEEMMTTHPEEYFWLHNRWKV